MAIAYYTMHILSVRLFQSLLFVIRIMHQYCIKNVPFLDVKELKCSAEELSMPRCWQVLSIAHVLLFTSNLK